MTSSFLLIATIGGFSYQTVILSERTKRVASAPPGYERTWKERVETIVANHPKDTKFSSFMRQKAIQLRKRYYQEYGDGVALFEENEDAGLVEVFMELESASPEIVSVNVGTSYYSAGSSHPGSMDASSINWSRRLNRPLRQNDLFAIPPDRALRRLALSRFDNRNGLQNNNMADGLPLEWNTASIGPQGITWSFGPYKLGGYASSGSATIQWAALKRYLRRLLLFSISAIRKARPRI